MNAISEGLKQYCEDKLGRIPLVGTPHYHCPFCTKKIPGGGEKGGAVLLSGNSWECSSCKEHGTLLDLMERLEPDSIDTKLYRKALEEEASKLGRSYIQDEHTRNGIAAYREVLHATRDVFGDEAMTEAVICKAIEAGSYGMWRSVMGPKFDDKKGRVVL